MSVISVGTRVEVEGEADKGMPCGLCIIASVIRNLTTGHVAILAELSSPKRPEMSSVLSLTPSEATSLVPLYNVCSPRDEYSCADVATRHVHESNSTDPHDENDISVQGVDGYEAVISIELAYDALHRTQALLAYMKIVDLRGPDIGRLLDESKHLYERALSTFQRREFSSASELASASAGLAYCVEILFVRALRGDANFPTLASLPPKHIACGSEVERAEKNTEYIANLLAQLKWHLETSSLSSEDREQIQRLFSWTEDFYEECKKLYQCGASEDAMKMVEAAVWAGQSAQHICKQSYPIH